MKLVMLSVHAEYVDIIESIIDKHEAPHYFVYPRIEGRDSKGFHEGSQVHPGNLAALHVRVADETVSPLLDDLRQFREEKKAHDHLEAIVINIVDHIGPEE